MGRRGEDSKREDRETELQKEVHKRWGGREENRREKGRRREKEADGSGVMAPTLQSIQKDRYDLFCFIYFLLFVFILV